MLAQYHWWEKTVEYTFISWSQLKFDATPLDGDLEQAGDTLFLNENNEFFLIEFKRQKDDAHIKSELNKFTDYQDAVKKIQNHLFHQCHFCVYGAMFYKHGSEETKKQVKFGLVFEHYIDFVKNQNKHLGYSFTHPYDFFEKYAINATDFFNYLRFFCSLKTGKELYGTSESPFANTLVATKDGGAMVSLDELISRSPQLQQAIDVPEPNIQQQEQTREKTIEGPSMSW